MATVPAWAHYREATKPGESCGTCDFFEDGRCEMFDGAAVERDHVCDKWEGRVAKTEHDPLFTQPAKHHDRSDAELALVASLTSALEPDQIAKADPPKAAGIAVRAADTGRVLMIQRSTTDDADPAAGKWEFPGGCLNDGEHPRDGARREWQEEMGLRLPRGRHAGEWRSGVYHGFVHEVPSERAVRLNLDPEDRRVLNPDDPDGDGVEVAAWWRPDEMKRSSAVRAELRAARPWVKVAKGAGILFLISHAKTRYNRPGQPHDIVQGWRNIPLDSTGVKQAHALGEWLADQHVDAIYASSLKRASQTAEIAGKIAKVEVHLDDKFRPWNLGSLAGHSSMDVIPKLKPYMDDHPDKAVAGGESFNSYRDRFLPALEEILDKVEAGERVALVTHSRNVELVEGWLGGEGYRKKVDTEAIEADKIDPATVIEVAQDKGGKLAVKGKFTKLDKAESRAATLHLRVTGVSRTPAGHRVYRMATRDGHYIGRTGPTRVRARKGDVLKVQTTDFLSDAQGDMHWTNPDVVSHYTDAPHSWRELQALAGGALEKDGAPGEAGDIPPVGDRGNMASEMPSGPTLESVHVNAPLSNISVAYAGKRLRWEVNKAQPWKQLVYGVVLEPNSIDSQDDFMLPTQVEKTAHGYLKRALRGQSSVMKLQHRLQGFKRTRASIVPVETFIAPCDFSYEGGDPIKKGSWVMVVHVEDAALWQDFLDGKYAGFSVGGMGKRRPVTMSAPLLPDHGFIGVPQAADWAPLPHPDTFGTRVI